MKNTIEIERIKNDSLFKLILIGFFLSLFPLFLIIGTVYFGFNEQEIVAGRVLGLVLKLLFGSIVIFLFVCFVWANLALGLWIYSAFKNITIKYVPKENGSESNLKQV